MVTLLFSIIFFSILLIFILFFIQRHNYTFSQDKSSLVAIFFTIWMISSVFFGGAFYIIPAPLFFDLTIERLLFSVVILLAAYGFIKGLQQKLFFNHTIEILMALFIAICLISMVRHGFFPKIPGLPSPWFVFITAYLFPFITFYFAKKYLYRAADIKLVFTVIFYIGAYLSIMALFEFYQIDQFIFPRYIADPDIGIHYGQARGPFLNSPHLGAAVLFGLACGLHLLSYKQRIGKLNLFILLLFIPPAVFFSQTRAVYLAFVLMLLIYLLFYRTNFSKWKAIALPVSVIFLLILASIPILAQQDRRAGGVVQVETIKIREGLTQLSFIMIKDHPVTGVGLAQFLSETRDKYRGLAPLLSRYPEEDIYIHNHLLGMTTELGFTGVIVYLSIIILMYKRLFALSRHLSSSHQFLNVNFLIVVGAIWTVFLINFNFSSPEYQVYPNALIFALAGIVDGLYQRLKFAESYPVAETSSPRHEYQITPAGLYT